jgi:hypothetical protein
MRRAYVLIALTAVVCHFALPGVQAREPNPIIELARKVNERVDFEGVDDPNATLKDVLEKLEALTKVHFSVNDAAFSAEGLENLLTQRVVGADRPIPKMTGVTLDTVLRKVLSRITSQSGTTYLIRRDGIEITSGEFLHIEVYGIPMQRDPDPLPVYQTRLPLVYVEFEKRPLAEALKELATATETNVVLDARAEEFGKTLVTATLTNVPLDHAVLMLADMAGLKPVRIGKALYITTAENAVKLQKEQDEKHRLLAMPQVPAGFGGLGGAVLPTPEGKP